MARHEGEKMKNEEKKDKRLKDKFNNRNMFWYMNKRHLLTRI